MYEAHKQAVRNEPLNRGNIVGANGEAAAADPLPSDGKNKFGWGV